MRRAVIVLGSTVAGIAALLSYKTHSLAVASTPASTGYIRSLQSALDQVGT